MEILLHTLEHSFLDTLKMLPFLLIAFFALELLESKSSDKSVHLIEKAGKLGPVIGAVLGLVPQCGFSVIGANFYSKKIITLGTLVAIFLSTSDEAFLVMLTDPQRISDILLIMAIKLAVAIVFGYLVDFLFKTKIKEHHHEHEHEHMAQESCCYNHSFKQIAFCTAKRTLSVWLFVFLASFVLTFLVEFFGEDKLHAFMLTDSVFQPFLTALIGLIPNCAPSVILSQMYLSGAVTLGSVVSGLCTSAGVGLLVLFRVNKPLKDNLKILALLYCISAFSGVLIQLI